MPPLSPRPHPQPTRTLFDTMAALASTPPLCVVQVLGRETLEVPNGPGRINVLRISAPLHFSGCDWAPPEITTVPPPLPPRRPSSSSSSSSASALDGRAETFLRYCPAIR